MRRWLLLISVLGLVAAIFLLLPLLVSADNCSSLFDCWYSAAGAAAGAAGAGAAAALAGGVDDPRCVVIATCVMEHACPNETVEFNAVGEPQPGRMTWSGGGNPATGDGLSFKTRFADQGEKTVTATWTSDKGKICTATASVKIWELSGAQWCDRFTHTNDISALADPFRSDVLSFKAALEAAGATVHPISTYRATEACYLMHYSYQIAKNGLYPGSVEHIGGVDICWLYRHEDGTDDLEASQAAAQAMVDKFGSNYPPAFPSRHSERTAIDMRITWQTVLKVPWGPYETAQHKAPQGPIPQPLPTPTPAGGPTTPAPTSFLQLSGPGDGGTTPGLWDLGATYGVMKLPPDAKHWSDTGT